jgi:hypothetical protein
MSKLTYLAECWYIQLCGLLEHCNGAFPANPQHYTNIYWHFDPLLLSLSPAWALLDLIQSVPTYQIGLYAILYNHLFQSAPDNVNSAARTEWLTINGPIERDAHYDNLLTVAHAGPRARTPAYLKAELSSSLATPSSSWYDTVEHYSQSKLISMATYSCILSHLSSR